MKKKTHYSIDRELFDNITDLISYAASLGEESARMLMQISITDFKKSAAIHNNIKSAEIFIESSANVIKQIKKSLNEKRK